MVLTLGKHFEKLLKYSANESYKVQQLVVKLPCNEENLALLAILISDEIKIINRITTLIGRETSSEIVVALIRSAKLVDDNLLLFDLEKDETVGPLRF